MRQIRFGLLMLGILAGVLAWYPAVSLADETSEIEINLVKANLAVKEKNYQEALDLAEKVLAKQADSVPALQVKGRALFELGKTQEALDIFGYLEKKNTKDQSWRVAYGIVLSGAGRNGEAIDQLKRATRADARNGAARYHLGRVYYVDSQFKKAIPELSAAIDIGYRRPAALFYRGRARYETGDPAQAKADLQKVIEVAPGSAEAKDAKEVLVLLEDVEAAPVAQRSPWALRGRLGFSYDSNVILNPGDSPNIPPPPGGKENDGRIEVELGGNYTHQASKETDISAGYNFTGFFQLGFGNATTDFTLMSHNPSLMISHHYSKTNAISLRGDYILSTLGRLSGSDSFFLIAPPTVNPAIPQELFSQQAIATLDWLNDLGDDLSVVLNAQYSHDFRTEDPLGVDGILPNGISDADTYEGGIKAIQMFDNGKGRFSGTLSFFFRDNETDVDSFNGTQFTSKAFSYYGPRLRLRSTIPLEDVHEALSVRLEGFYGFEYHYKDEGINTKNRNDHRIYGTITLAYDATKNLAIEAAYRGEGLISNIKTSLPASIDPGYQRHVGTLSLIVHN